MESMDVAQEGTSTATTPVAEAGEFINKSYFVRMPVDGKRVLQNPLFLSFIGISCCKLL